MKPDEIVNGPLVSITKKLLDNKDALWHAKELDKHFATLWARHSTVMWDGILKAHLETYKQEREIDILVNFIGYILLLQTMMDEVKARNELEGWTRIEGGGEVAPPSGSQP